MARNAPSLHWRGVVAYSSSRQEIKSRIPFDGSSWTMELKNFSWWVWVGRIVKHPSILVRRKMGCMALGQCLSLHKWAVSVHMFNSYEGIGQEIIASYKGHESVPAVLLCPLKEMTVSKRGQVVVRPQCLDGWSLARGDTEVQLSTEQMWHQKFNHDHCFTFVVQSDNPHIECLELPIHVEYIRGDSRESNFTLEAVHRLNAATDLSRGISPSSSLSLSDQDPQGFLYAGPDGLHSSGRAATPPLASLPTATATDSSSPQTRIPPSGLHCFGTCAVSPLHSQPEEESQMTVRVPSGSEVPSAGCTLRYTGATGHPVRESHGERVDSRTVKTVTPAWPHADNVEVVILLPDGETRLAYLVRGVIDVDKSATSIAVSGEPPGIIKQRADEGTEGHARQAAGSETSDRRTSSQSGSSLPATELERPASVLDIFEVADVARTKWYEIGVHLGFKLEEMEDYREKYPDSMLKRLSLLIADWVKREKKATAAMLLAACKKAGVEGAATKVLQKH